MTPWSTMEEGIRRRVSIIVKQRAHDLFAWAIIVWTFAVTIARAIRAPNDFVEAHWLLDYRFGFMKRGLIGALCSLVTHLLGLKMNLGLILVLSVVTLGAMSATMLVLLYRMSQRYRPIDGVRVLGVVFVSSPFVVMSAHLLGYFDALLYVCAIVSAGLILCHRPFLAAFVSLAAILSHESYILIGFPLVCLASVAMLLPAGGQRSGWRRYAIALCIPVMAFLAISVLLQSTTDAMTLRHQLTGYLHSFGFVPTRSAGVAAWQTTGFMQFFRQQNSYFFERLLDPIVFASVGPTLLALLVFIYASFRIRAFSLVSIVVLGAVCAPVAMHLVAWDTARISTYSIGSAFIASWILAETRAARGSIELFLLIAFPALILNVFGHVPLMDDRVERFSDIARLLMYAPAIALLLTVAVRTLAPRLAEFRETRILNKGIDGDEE